ncbi:MAG: peptidoglycan-binding protein [Verrucomicrobiaceae bacterium]|nr:MAG: peptidoglycan-binding protein [Verrucomicrobiaceae bacterium]
MKLPSFLTVLAVLTVSAGWAPAQYDRDHGHRPGPPPGPPHRPERDYRRGSSLEARVQMRLKRLGYYYGPVDGSFGRGSRAALARFQRQAGLRPTGALDGRTIRALRL